MRSLSRKQWPDFLTHAVATLNMGWSLEDSRPDPGSGSNSINRELKMLSNVETERLQDGNGGFDLPQKPLHASQVLHRRGRNFFEGARTALLACVPDTRWAICLQATLGIQILLCAAFEAQIALRAIPIQDTVGATRMMQIQLATVMFESCYQLVLGLNAVRTRNIVTAIGICTNNISVLLFVVLAGVGIEQQLNLVKSLTPSPADPETSDEFRHYADIVKALNTDVFTRGFGALVGSLALCSLAISFITYKLYGQFAWDIYRHIATGDRLMRRRYLMYEIYISLLHLDFFFLLGFWLQSTTGTGGGMTLEFGTPNLCVAPFLLFFAGRFVRKEKRWGCILTIHLLLGEFACIVVFLPIWNWEATMFDKSPLARTVAYASLTILSLMATAGMTIVCMSNFGKGLEPYLRRHQVTAANRGSIESSKRANGFGDGFEYQELSKPAPVRMEID